ncbi:os-C isoform 1-T1 [Cochliomyia hominivorax]
MAFHLKRTLIIFATLMVIMQITKGQDDPPADSEEEEDDSSSEETVEDSNESRKRRRRSLETSVEGADVSVDEPKPPVIPGLPALPAIPGLPDPETILKIAEILTSVGQQVLPILVSGNSGVADFVTNRAARDMKLLKNIKNEIDVLTENMKKK